MSLQIEKVINIKGIEDLKSDESKIYNSRVGLIYGMNGSGKSTIKYIFESLFKREALPKNFSMEEHEQEVIVKINGYKYTYSGSWDKKPKDTLYIFDSNYIEENIYVNGKMSAGNKRALPTVIYGKENIEMYEDIVNLEKQIKDLTDNNKLIKEEMLKSNFSKILKEIIKEIDFIKDTLLVKKNYLKEVEFTLINHIKRNLENNEKARVWLKEGLTYHNKDCPMCGQSLSDEAITLFDIIDKSTLIDNDYLDIKKELEFRFSNIKKLINDESFTVKIGNKEIVLRQISEKIEHKTLNFEEEVFLFKENKLLEKAYNKIKANIEAIKNIDDEDNKKTLKHSSIEKIRTYEQNINTINKIKKTIKREKKIIDDNLEKIIKDDLSQINNDLKAYGFPYEIDFNEMSKSLSPSITKTQANLTVGLTLKHRNSDKAIKDNEIKETLSYGEKSVLSWVIFVTNLKRETKNGSNIIILDDPIASHDDSKKFPLINTVNELKLNKGNKIMLLTHDKSFVALYNNLNTSKIYQLKDNKICTMNVPDFLKNELIENIHKIESISELNETNLIEYLVISRKLIESSALYSKSNYNDDKKLKNAHSNLSKLLHNESNRLFKATINTIENIIRVHINKYKINISIDIKNIDILNVAIANKENIYSYRIIVETYLRYKLTNRISIKEELTIGELFNTVLEVRGNSFKHYDDIKSILSILNTTYHNDSSTGFGIKDIPEESLKYTNDIVGEILKHQFFS